MLQATIPAFGLVLAHAMLPDDRLTVPKVIGVALGILGVAFIFSDQLETGGQDALWGSAAIVGAAAAVALANVLVKKSGRRYQPTVISAVQMLFGLIPLLVVGYWTEGSPFRFHWTPLAWISLLYLAVVGSVVAFLLYYWLVQRMDVTKTMLIPLVTPVIAVALGMATLGERITWRLGIGTLAIIGGVGWIFRGGSPSWRGSRRPRVDERRAPAAPRRPESA